MRRYLRRCVAIMFAIVALLPWCTSAQSATPQPGGTRAVQDPAIYCQQQGGTVVTRTPALGTNAPATMLDLAGSRTFCEFTGGNGADPDTSRIAIDLNSLMAVTPTLAALAYLTTPPMPDIPASVNPASVYCTHLGGSELGTSSGMGGGWITDTGSDDPDVLQVCTFPDGSMIDSWGITYHTNGVIRGADLQPILHYQPTSPPLVFPGQ